jgi:hypothetical protein
MPQHTYYVMGQWNVACDVCGRVFKSAHIKTRWDNARVCSACWEPRHPQDFVKAITDNPSVPFARKWVPTYYGAPTPDDTVIGTHEIGSNTGGL